MAIFAMVLHGAPGSTADYATLQRRRRRHAIRLRDSLRLAPQLRRDRDAGFAARYFGAVGAFAGERDFVEAGLARQGFDDGAERVGVGLKTAERAEAGDVHRQHGEVGDVTLALFRAERARRRRDAGPAPPPTCFAWFPRLTSLQCK